MLEVVRVARGRGLGPGDTHEERHHLEALVNRFRTFVRLVLGESHHGSSSQGEERPTGLQRIGPTTFGRTADRAFDNACVWSLG